ncbi:MAG TPA: replication-associated recombination protein A [Clostridia bacterium]|nr:replication-associated recombination protein A [Clostridia bacterium]
MNLFDYSKEQYLGKNAPLALRMRPRSLDEYAGQKHIVGEGRLLRRAIQADQLSTLIFYGPPGTGKTALARVIASSTSAEFIQLNAVSAGINDIRKIIEEAGERLGMWHKRTILFIDEIHRFNKTQQDALLPAVEQGIITLIGATTENPYFEVNGALLSRSLIFPLYPLNRDDILEIAQRALQDEKRGLGNLQVSISSDALEHIIDVAQGDARRALNALELAALTTSPDAEGKRSITLGIAEESIQQRVVLYDKTGDQHYDIISAFIKSLRGSDPDGALHWFSRMLAAGEDPRFIARRMIILAAEDIGLADPQALLIANGAAQALEFVGLPEARLPLAEAVIYLACAPKSNSVTKAIDQAQGDVRNKTLTPVPIHLRDASYPGARQMGHGRDYLYPHDFPGNYVFQKYLPDNLTGVKYYQPGENGFENVLRERLSDKPKKE